MKRTRTWPLFVRASAGSIRPSVVVKVMTVPFCTGVPAPDDEVAVGVGVVGVVGVPGVVGVVGRRRRRRGAVLDRRCHDLDLAVHRNAYSPSRRAR